MDIGDFWRGPDTTYQFVSIDSIFDNDLNLKYAALFRVMGKVSCLRDYGIYKQVVYRQIWNDKYYEFLEKQGLTGHALSFPRHENEPFNLAGLKCIVFRRFVELLASINLYHFSKCSKKVNFDCLDFRGLEFRTVKLDAIPSEDDAETVSFHIFEGMLCGTIKDKRFTIYQICHGSISMNFDSYLNDPATLNFAKKHRILELSVKEEVFDQFLDLCPTIFHANVQFLNMQFKSSNYIQGQISLEKLTQFMDYCKLLRSVNLKFKCDDAAGENDYYVILQGNPAFLQIKKMIEAYAQATENLELLILLYKDYFFQLDEKILKRLIKISSDYYLTSCCDIDNNEYLVFDYAYRSTYDYGYFKYVHFTDPLNLKIRDGKSVGTPDWVLNKSFENYKDESDEYLNEL